MQDFPPRGAARRQRVAGDGTSQDAAWFNPAELPYRFPFEEDTGQVLLGLSGGYGVGFRDDRHMVMVAGTRAGKTSTVLVPNLLRYRGPCVIIDPKGELARLTAERRVAFGPVFVLDPFKKVPRSLSGVSFKGTNPLTPLLASQNLPADCAQIADAMIVPSGGKDDAHWTGSAKNVIKALLLHIVLHRKPAEHTLATMRRLLNGPPLHLYNVFMEMADLPADPTNKQAVEFDAAVKNSGGMFKGYAEMKPAETAGGKPTFAKWTGEFLSILSNARQQTDCFDDVAGVTDENGFALADIGRRNMTIYLVIPAERLDTHARWLRLVVMQALTALQQNEIPLSDDPVWFVLEEFAALGYVSSIETATSYIAGSGVKLWTILQGITQLQHHYPKTWESFFGNAGVIQAFGVGEEAAKKLFSEMLGQARYEHRSSAPQNVDPMKGRMGAVNREWRLAPLLSPDEVEQAFARETNRQLVRIKGQDPMYLDRMPREG